MIDVKEFESEISEETFVPTILASSSSSSSSSMTSTTYTHPEMNFTETNQYLFYKISMKINLYATLVIVCVGLVGNLMTVYLLKSKPKSLQNGVRFSYRNRPGAQLNTFSSSELYMMALAISDTLFLVSHLIEDIAPEMSQWFVFQQINKSNLFCKVVLFVRNSARVCSSYLVVFFAYERFTVIKTPLNRLKFHNKRITKVLI